VDSFTSYPKVFAIGHRATLGLFNRPVIVEEKIDGSQFSFGVDSSGRLHCRSRGQVIDPEHPEKMFALAVESVKRRIERLQPGWTYRAEYLSKPKHNTLAYGRCPRETLMIFDITFGLESYISRGMKEHEAAAIDLECVPLVYQGMVTSPAMLQDLLDRDSILGGCKIEGVVVKPADYGLFGEDSKPIIAKYVSGAFKEKHQSEWRKSNPTNGDILQVIAGQYATEARWEKAVQHLREAGQLADDPRDIGALIAEVKQDLVAENADEIKDELYNWAIGKIQRQAVYGLAEWYKARLMKEAFVEQEAA
jgi:hypothetical protein